MPSSVVSSSSIPAQYCLSNMRSWLAQRLLISRRHAGVRKGWSLSSLFVSFILNKYYFQNSLFSPNVAYYLNVRLKFADVINTNKLGLFQNVITITDENQKILKQYTKSAYVKEAGLIQKVHLDFLFLKFIQKFQAMHLFLFPFYFLGFFHDYSTLAIPMSADYLEGIDSPSTKLVFVVQDKFANVGVSNYRIKIL